MLWHPSDQEAALCWGDWSDLLSSCWRLIHPNTYTCAFMFYVHCSMSPPPFFVDVFSPGWTVHVVNAGCGLDPRGRYNLSSSCGITDLCQAACPCLPVFSVTCADLHTCHLFISGLCMLVRTTVCSRAGTAPLLHFQGAVSWWWEVRSCLLTVHISVQEKPLQSCVFPCVSVLYQGVPNVDTLHNGFKRLPGKMD